ncbi:MAG: hypothetical protein ACFFD1_02230 [Candidatus Thorarchaeota archaeon]
MTNHKTNSDIKKILKKARLEVLRGVLDDGIALLDKNLDENDLENYIRLTLEKAYLFGNGDKLFDAEIIITKILYLLGSKKVKDPLLIIKTKMVSAWIRTQLYPPEYSEAIELIRDSLQLLERINLNYFDSNDINELFSYGFYVQAAAHYYLGDFNAAEMLINLSLSYLEQNEDLDITLKFLIKNVQAIIAKYQGNFPSALKFYFESLDILHQFNFFGGYPLILNNIGSLFLAEGKFELAHRWYKKAELACEDFNDNKLLAIVFTNLGEIYNLRGEYDTAYGYYFASLGLLMSLELSFDLTLKRMAMLEKNFSHFSDSAALFQRAIEERSKSSTKDLPDWYAHYARVLLRLSRISEAQECVYKAYKILEHSNDRIPPPSLPLTEGLITQTLEGAREAQTYFLRGYGLAKEKGNPLDVCEGCLFIVQNFLLQYQSNSKDYQFNLAQKYLKEVHAYSKSNNLYPYQITTTILTAAFLSAEYNFGSALSILNNAMNEAKRLNFKREYEEALRLQQQIKGLIYKMQDLQFQQSNDTKSPEKAVPYYTVGLVSALSRVLNINTGKDYSKEDFMFIVFKFTDDGPQPFFMLPEVNDDSIFDFLLNFGVILNFLVGQGQHYFGGLYGPIPIQSREDESSHEQLGIHNRLAGKSSMIYASLVNDSEVDEIRLEGKNYIIFTIIHPSTLDATFVGREELRTKFEQFIKMNLDVAQWQTPDLENLSNEVIKTLLQTSV